MHPRVVFRTHYQVDEPAYVGILLDRCTSPVRGAYKEAVSERFAEAMRQLGKPFNRPAAGYAVDLARGLGVINEQCCWTDRGQFLALLSRSGMARAPCAFDLDEKERLAYFRVFLESDGAALAFLARRTQQHGRLPYGGCNWSSIAREMFVDIYSGYLRITQNTADRVSLRNAIERLRTRDYRGKTGAHKMFIHLQALFRFGMLNKTAEGGARAYCRPASSAGPSLELDRFLEEAGEPLALERLLEDGSWERLAASTLGLQCEDYPGARLTVAQKKLSASVADRYTGIMATGVPLCSLAALCDVVKVDMLAESSLLVTVQDVLDCLKCVGAAHRRGVRLHVDRRGTPAYVRLSEAALGALCEGRGEGNGETEGG